jgi:hypothetical protein
MDSRNRRAKNTNDQSLQKATMKLAVFGDVHAYWEELNITIARVVRRYPNIHRFIQVGDWGYKMHNRGPLKLSSKFLDDQELTIAASVPKHWCDGNHDNHEQLALDNGLWQPDWRYQSRGSVLTVGEHNIMFFGGASSIDKDHRVTGATWWPQESIKYTQVAKALEYNQKVDIIISHEFPLAFPYASWKDDFGKSDREGLQALLDHFKPRLWIFGHHHDYKHGETNGTLWACAPIIEQRTALIVDLDDMSITHFKVGHKKNDPRSDRTQA